ncbi:MAG: FAD-dependent oxidoreductase, partial [Proteobacteria bacterium]|nr:FAD-dependent oxidoreductase [Pseudomonadota bacterium]
KFLDHYSERAAGGVGYCTTEQVCIDPAGRAEPHMPCIFDDSYIEGYEQLAERIHSVDGRVFVQLNHAGRQTKSSITGIQPIAPSPIACPVLRETPRQLEAIEIKELVSAFAMAAKRVQEAGCDGVEFHMAHGYLVCQFLSGYSNHRTDQYGGCLENRCRFAMEIVQATREKVGPHFPIVCRISANEMVEGGINEEEAVVIARNLESAGADAIHVSACNYQSFAFNMPCYFLSESCFVHLADIVRQAVAIPVIAVGRIRTIQKAEEIIQSNKADLVAMGRALIADPKLPEKGMQRKSDEIRPCLSCNRCVESMLQGNLECSVNPRQGKHQTQTEKTTTERKRVLIVGGGPAGMEAAITLAEKGHNVLLSERNSFLGGQLRYAAEIPGKEVLKDLIKYYERSLPNLGIRVELDNVCTLETVKELQPELIVFANGPGAVISGPWENADNVLTFEQAYENAEQVAQKIAVLGGGPQGAEIALYFEAMNKEITIIEKRKKIGMGLPSSVRFHLDKKINEGNINVLTKAEILAIQNGAIKLRIKKAEQELTDIGSIIVATGRKSNELLYNKAKAINKSCIIIGDAKKPRGIKEAIAEGAHSVQNF